MDKMFKQGDSPTSIKAKFESLNPIIDRKSISQYEFKRIDETQYKNISTRDTEGRWVRLSVSATRYGTTNKFAITCSFWCSSGQVYNGFGQRVKFSGSNISGLPGTYTTTISGGSWATSSKTFDVTISANTTLTVSTICAWCEDGLTSGDHPYNYERTKFTNSDSVSLTYIVQEIIPTKPLITIFAPDNGSSGRIDYTNINSSDATYRCYPAHSANGNGVNNTLRFYLGRPGNSTQGKVVIERWVSGSSWTVVNDTGWKTDSMINLHKTFASSDRISSGVWWRAYSVAKSSTGHTSTSDYLHFIINDIPTFSNNQPNIKCSSSIIKPGTSVTVSWNGANNGYLTLGYKLRYKRQQDSSWTEVDSSGTSKSIDLSNTNTYSRGTVIQFEVKALDSYDSDSYRGSASVKINQLPTLSSSTITTDKDGNPYYNHYVDNVKFTFPTLSDADGQSTVYKVEYKVGDGAWTSYNNSYSSNTLTLNCSSYQNTRGGKMQLRVTAYDGMEYGSSASSAVLIRNKLPVMPQITVDYGKKYLSNTDDSPHNGHAEKIYQIKWNNAVNFCNNQKIANSKFKLSFYRGSELYATYNGQDLDSSTGGIPKVTSNHYINSVPRGSTFRITIQVTDILGESSSTEISYVRNLLPSVPTKFRVGFSGSINSVTNRQALFNRTADVNSDVVYYHLQVKRYKSTAWVDITNDFTTSATSVVMNFTDASSNYGDTYRIRAIDEHEAASDWTSLEDQTLSGVVITYPISRSNVYGAKPRILFKVNSDSTERYMSVEITVNGKKYNNLDNPQYFSLPLYKEGSLGVFRCPADIPQGLNSLNIKSFLGNINSNDSTHSMFYVICLENKIVQGDKLTASRINNIQKMVNDYYSAYGCTFTKNTMTSINAGSTISTDVIYNNIYDNILGINKTINDYNKNFYGDGKLSVSLPDINVDKTTKHLISHINDIVDIIKTKI